MAMLGPMSILIYQPFMDRLPIPTFPKFLNLVFCFIIKNTIYFMPFMLLSKYNVI